MPIYDFNGTTKQEIGKIYDFNGTASSQIGKVYDNNGSANSLIYSAEKVLDNISYTIGSGPSSSSGSKTWTITTWDLSGFNTLSIGSYSANAQAYYWKSGGTVYSNSRRLELHFNGSGQLNISSSGTFDLSSYTDTQKSAITVKGYLYWSISTTTNSAFKGRVDSAKHRCIVK